MEPTNWAGNYVKLVCSNGLLGDNIGFVIKDEGSNVDACWRAKDDSFTRSSSRKLSLRVVSPSPDDEAWVEKRELASLIKH